MTARIVSAGAAMGLGFDPHDPPAALRVSGRLFAETADGRRLVADGGGVGVAFARSDPNAASERVTRHDIQQALDSMLGRSDRVQSRHLAWEQLRGVLKREGIQLKDEDLIALPFVLELSEELQAELDP